MVGIQVDTSTLACTYAALICYDDGLPVSAENIAALIKVRPSALAPNQSIRSWTPASLTRRGAGIGLGSRSGGGGASTRQPQDTSRNSNCPALVRGGGLGSRHRAALSSQPA